MGEHPLETLESDEVGATPRTDEARYLSTWALGVDSFYSRPREVPPINEAATALQSRTRPPYPSFPCHWPDVFQGPHS